MPEDALFRIVGEIPRIGVADQPNHSAQVDAIALRAGLSTYEQLAGYCGLMQYHGPLLLIGARCVIIGIPGVPPAIFERKAGTRMPSMMTMARNFSSAVAQTLGRAVSGEQVKVSEAVQRARYAVCEACPHLQGNRCVDVVLTNGEVEKGCGCNLTAKAWLAGQKCPQNKWPAEE